jgi:hypothetical protein
MNESTTRVVFRVFDAGDVIALMPDLIDNYHGDCTSYQHVGQHGAADYDHVIRATRPATVAEYAPLLNELRVIGYNVRPIARRRRTV